MMESPSTPRRNDPLPAVDPRAAERESLLHRLLDSVKQCQVRFGKKTTTTTNLSEVGPPTAKLATEAEAQVICLLTNLEAALCHGLKQSGSTSLSLGGLFSSSSNDHPHNSSSSASSSRLPSSTFWPFVRTFLGADESARFDVSAGVTTDYGRGRVWLRTALNENSLERYFYSLVNDVERQKVTI